MNYPTLEEVNAASRGQLLRWNQQLPAPGVNYLRAHDAGDRDHAEWEEAVQSETKIAQRIQDRLNETPLWPFYSPL